MNAPSTSAWQKKKVAKSTADKTAKILDAEAAVDPKIVKVMIQQAVEKKLEQMMKENPLRLEFYDRYKEIIDEYNLPAHTVGFGVKGCITWSTTPVRNYRDYKATDFQVAELSWLWSLNRGIITPPGLDEQWLISVVHTEEEALQYATIFGEFVDELTA